jgi:hypothetical protein
MTLRYVPMHTMFSVSFDQKQAVETYDAPAEYVNFMTKSTYDQSLRSHR